ncbi:rRNA (cytosine-C5-)-methyltransferase NOP2 [Lachancea thermotolerans CBS 6340]|uniref:Nucleolar protein 2 n=1 Tax=Lachancea thermotolerans (strain ATCC 56472 / CBS 6340 / NRRL Y-8284) TaxID=559295 RepID=C5DMJ5_LACTC|nr:KLTH0G09460p [Lachancea thermotolerans CBS 6340]CAR25006.1 KLTH0G09460p [Lachancea thermotolerans CBS 6340]
MGSRRHKNKQGAPPSLDEFQAKKSNKSEHKGKSRSEDVDGKKHKSKRRAENDTKSGNKRSKTERVEKTKSKEPEQTEEEELPEVDLEELSKARKTLFDDEEDEGQEEDGADEFDEDLKDEFDLEQEYEGEDDDDEGGRPVFSDDEGVDMEDLNAANMEALSMKLDQEQALEEEEAEKELAEAAQLQPRAEILPTEEEEEALRDRPTDLNAVRTRMIEIVKVLEDFKNLGAEGRSRSEYVDRLLKDICEYFGYSQFLAEKLFNLFSPTEALEFFEANEVSRPVTIRTNSLKTRRRDLAQTLVNRGVNLKPIGPWTKVGLQIFDSQVPIGATPEYLAGHYILQAASSFLPVVALDPHENERILDMAAAPGGKTTYISAMMKNTGCVFANDANKARTKSLIANIHRLGCTNTIVCNYDAREFPKVIGGFDRILLDAPCSGTGVIAKDQSVKVSRTDKDFMQIPHLQKQLLLSAIDSVDANSKTGGVIVYSTCSVAVEENEAVVDYALRKRPNVKLVDAGLAIGKEAFVSYRGKKFHPSVKLARRYYPHVYNVDGFFVAKFQKIAPSKHDDNQANAREKENAARQEALEEGIIHDDFADFGNEEDKKYIEKSRKVSLLKKGIDPKATKKNQGSNSTPNKSA